MSLFLQVSGCKLKSCKVKFWSGDGAKLRWPRLTGTALVLSRVSRILTNICKTQKTSQCPSFHHNFWFVCMSGEQWRSCCCWPMSHLRASEAMLTVSCHAKHNVSLFQRALGCLLFPSGRARQRKWVLDDLSPILVRMTIVCGTSKGREC